jgi:predicted  nucleic acid-binding Zn-ribbon protein
MMNNESCTQKHEHKLQTDNEEIEKIEAELVLATEKVIYFDNLIVSADSLRKLAEAKIKQTQTKKLDSLSNKLDSQIFKRIELRTYALNLIFV